MAASQADVGQAIQRAGLDVSNLRVKDVGGITAVYGAVASDEDKRRVEQAIESEVGKISNHLEVRGSAPAASGARYTVKAGDTLSGIAKEKYGDASQWKRIQAANADLISDPDKIQIGWTLTIP